ncbi:piggyBac transposable element-derived protein 2-like [Ixodes scapularis]|uniref:piggyBac transposable element-derived protein 2-like n=1 Tax=Ixodes scapularis TaxID=6945 RepID=UPI001A9CFB1B|nr:piggyBac transposable element-derived protein 2-like [Ixodes scapularis]
MCDFDAIRAQWLQMAATKFTTGAEFLVSCFFFLAGAPIPTPLFYSHQRLQAATDALFEDLDNGNLSDVEGECDEEGDAVELHGTDPAQPDSESESSDDECGLGTSGGWKRRPFQKPDSTFQGGFHEVPELEEEIPSPYQYLRRYVPKSVFLELVNKTNQYSVLQEGSSVKTDEEEIRRLVALHLTMGVLHYPRLRLYWRPSMKSALVASTGLSRNRFEKLRNNLHIVDVNNPSTTDRLWKVRPLMDAFQKRCNELDVEERLSLDEQIVPFKGRLDIKQYIRGKPNPWGVKIFMLCGESGLIYDFLPYQGSTTSLAENLKCNFGITGAIVLQLAQRIPSGLGHKLFFDNYFTSVPLLREMLKKKIFAAGTVRSNRCEKCPLMSEKDLKKKGRGSSDCLVSGDGQVVVTRWMDNRVVTLASNFVAVENEDTARRWSKADKCFLDIKRPAVVGAYNRSMGGVDKVDFLVALYRTTIRSRKWTLRMIFHFMNLAVVNAWLEYRKDADRQLILPTKQLDLLDFTLGVIEALSAAESKPVSRKRGRPSDSPLQPSKQLRFAENRPVQDVRFDQMGHWPVHEDSREQRCKMERCTGKTRVMCDKCNVHLCLTKSRNCFKAFHLRN